MPDALYERDVLAWSVQQSELLRRLADGERLNAAIDWAHVIEEVGDVGRSEMRATKSFLQQLIVHLLKLSAWPGSQAANHWQDEAYRFADDAKQAFSPSMRQHIDLADLYGSALRPVRQFSDESGEARDIPQICPFNLDELLAGDVPALQAKLRA